MFCHPDGQPLHPEAVSKTFERRVRRSGLPYIRLHDLRHTHAAHLIAPGQDALVIAKRLGHASVSFTPTTSTGISWRRLTPMPQRPWLRWSKAGSPDPHRHRVAPRRTSTDWRRPTIASPWRSSAVVIGGFRSAAACRATTVAIASTSASMMPRARSSGASTVIPGRIAAGGKSSRFAVT